jgi:4-hydroxybenzoate polyprenyltransferase
VLVGPGTTFEPTQVIGVAAVAGLLAYEHWLVRPDDLSRVNQAFFQVNGVISVGLFVVVVLQLAVACAA